MRVHRLGAKTRATAVTARHMPPPVKVPRKKIARKKKPDEPAVDTHRHYIKLGPLMPVYRRRTATAARRSQVKSWRVWVHWSDGDWTAETMKSFKEATQQQIKNMVRRGAPVWPWPDTSKPEGQYRATELKKLKMTRYEDRVTKSNLDSWEFIPQTAPQVDDTDGDKDSEVQTEEAASATDLSDDDSDDSSTTGRSRLSSTEEED